MSFNKEVCYKSLKQAASHYRGETNYCSVIALAIATGCKFGKARSIMAKEVQRKTGEGTRKHTVHKFVYEKLGKTLEPLLMGKGFMISNSASRLPRHGTFLVYSSGHVTCLKDGVVHDWCVEPVPTGYRRKDKRMTEVYQVLDA